jgi:nitrate reductase assembly molybdenum cofactor insertion protein NarJ
MGGSKGGNQMIETVSLYKILSLGLSYPDETSWAIMEKQFTISEGLFQGEMLSSLNIVKECFQEYRQKLEKIRYDYMSIFDTGRKISPYETEYMTEKVSRKPFELVDLAGFYKAFGFRIAQDIKHKESFDHISIELEFMAILTWKAAYARDKNQKEKEKIVLDARKSFFADHLAKWGFFYCDQISRLTGYDYFKRVAGLLKLVLTLECDRYGLDISLINKQMTRVPYEGVRGDELTCN